jgi:hypothetical protein
MRPIETWLPAGNGKVHAGHRSGADYRKQAAGCRALAAEAVVSSVRATLREIATTYETLAQQIDELAEDDRRRR